MEWLEINHPEWLKALPIKFGKSDEVEATLNAGRSAAVLMVPPGFMHEECAAKIHIAFDWDSTLSDSSGDKLIESHGRRAKRSDGRGLGVAAGKTIVQGVNCNG